MLMAARSPFLLVKIQIPLSIDPTTGEVSVVGDIDYETKSSYSFTVVTTNEAGETSEIQVTINVANLDEAEPVITSSELASVNEGVGADHVVYTATATDANDVSGGVSYSLQTAIRRCPSMHLLDR